MSSSADGCTVAFESAADLAPRDSRTVPACTVACVRDPNNADDALAPNANGPLADPDNNNDIFVWTARDGQIRRITAGNWFWNLQNIDPNGNLGLYPPTEHPTANGSSVSPSISADGRYLAFTSRAENPGLDGEMPVTGSHQSHAYGIFWMDLQTGQLLRVDHTRAGDRPESTIQSPVQITGNGQRVIWQQAGRFGAPYDNQIFFWDSATQVQRLVSTQYDGLRDGNGSSTSPTVSFDGSVITFQSNSSNLVGPGTGTTVTQVYMWVDSHRPFDTDCTDNYCDERSHAPGPAGTGTITRITNGDHSSNWPRISSDGSRIAFVSYANLDGQAAGHTMLNPGLEGESYANPAAGDLFVYTRAGGGLRRITNGARGSNYPGILPGSLSADGRFVSFQSTSSTPVLGGGDTSGSGAFVYDLTNSTLVTGAYGGANAGSVRPYVTPDGRTLYYWTDTGAAHTQLFGRSLN
jgi:Tol biopolymer transport system component